MRDLLFILPGTALLLCPTAEAATAACTVAGRCAAAQMLYSNYRFDRTAPLDVVRAPATSDVMILPIGVSLNAASVFSSSVNGGNAGIANEPARRQGSRPAPAAPDGFDGAGGADVLNRARLSPFAVLSPNSEGSGVLVTDITATPEWAVAAGWLRGRAAGVGRFTDVGPRVSAPNGAAGDTGPGLGGSDTPSTIATPEPLPFLLIGSGLVVLGALARRRGSAAVRS